MGALTRWRYCPRCASLLVHGGEHVNCDTCGFVFYASSAPAVSAFVLDDDCRVLLARRAYEPDAGLWDVLGGFLEEGEDPLEGIRRELREETGLTADVGRFIGAFVDTYGADSDATSVLNLVWEVTLGEGEPMPADDVSELRWFAPDALPPDGELAFRWLAPALRAWASRVSQRRRRAGNRPFG